MADEVGGVLVQGAAGVHRHQLHPTADAQHRQTGLVGGGQQRELPGVAIGLPACRPLVRLGAVAAGVDVRSARDHEGVDPTDHRPRGGRQRDGWQEDRYAARGLDRDGVLRGQQVGAGAPDTPGGLLAVGREPDDGCVHRSSPQSGVT